MILQLITVFYVALIYAKMETLIESGGRKWIPVYGKYSVYHLWLFMLDLAVNIPALMVSGRFYMFCVALFPLLEDIFYFAWIGKRIQPHNWTAKEGYFTVKGWVVPYWYVVVVAVLVFLVWSLTWV